MSSPAIIVDVLVPARIEWAEKIRGHWRETVQGILATGRSLRDAKADPEMKRQFEAMVEQDLPFSPRTARMLMAISRDDRIRNHGSVLPPYWRTDYELTQLSDEQFERGVSTGIINPEMERSDIDRLTGKRTKTLQTNSNEWWTPPQYIDAARQLMGGIDLDPASCEAANDVVGADEIFDQEADGLSQRWFGRIWLNPPYGRLSGAFVKKLVDEFDDGNVEQATVLVNSNATDTQWFKPLWDRVLCFTNHRIDFRSPHYKEENSTHGSVFIYFGENEEGFLKHFSPFGYVVKRLAHDHP